jgi:hypothetical protein
VALHGAARATVAGCIPAHWRQYFKVRAPRQTGKTTSLLALTRDLCAAG